MIERPPLRMWEGLEALGRCAVRTADVIATRRLDEPRTNVGFHVQWADGSMAAVYRETVDVTPTDTPTTSRRREFRMFLPCSMAAPAKMGPVISGRWASIQRGK